MRHLRQANAKCTQILVASFCRPVIGCEHSERNEEKTSAKKKKEKNMNSQRHGTVLSHGGQMTVLLEHFVSHFYLLCFRLVLAVVTGSLENVIHNL